jgi:UDP-glucose 4-epimerase/UDP-glucuronate decarboxylase
MTHVLVAGGAGFIGSHLVERLLRRRDIASLVVVDNLWTGTAANLPRSFDNRLEFRQMDVERVDAVAAFDEIYHLASPASPPWYMAEPLRTMSANVLGCLRLLAALKLGGVLLLHLHLRGLWRSAGLAAAGKLSRLGGLHGPARLV